MDNYFFLEDCSVAKQSQKPLWQYFTDFLMLFTAFYLVELLSFLLLRPDAASGLAFGALWAVLLTGIILCFPRKFGRVVFGLVYYFILLWTLAQAGYYQVFDKMMWFSTTGYAGEGATFLGDVLYYFPFRWWLSLLVMLGLGVGVIWFFPTPSKNILLRFPYLVCSVACVIGLCFLPEAVFQKDNDIWGTHSEYAQSSSYRATYNTMYDTKKVYDITGIYQLTMRDIWVNELYPLTPAYRKVINQQKHTVDAYFAERGQHKDNEMTGIFKGKNVVLVLMESMDDWMITENDTPTLCRLMDEGINFTNFYTPGYGSARTLNSEFCMNTGIYLPTTGSYVFDYVTNSFKQSIASQMTKNGYSAKVFHYNDPDFYSRGVFEPAMGYESYVCYEDYTQEKNDLYSDTLLFDMEEISNLFFREGPSFNTIITRSAHLSYKYNEVLSYYALKQYPDYRNLYGSEEEDCARVKAKLVDDMFARLLEELEQQGQLENTVIIGMTDHYTYGYKDMDELYAHSGVDEELLLEKTPCFVWSLDGPNTEVTKTLNTSDFLPTMLNLLGANSPYSYLGQDAFDPNYKGYALFPNGSWICDGVAWQDEQILMNEHNREVTQEEVEAMSVLSAEYRTISNLLLTCNYYK